jgi:dTDP-4-amino-4,6-dideoxygalactose transaminase
MELGARYRVRIIEDACQSVGGSHRGRPLGVIGEIGAFSFNQFKIMTAGEGGAIVTNRRELYEKALIQHDGGCMFRQHANRLSVPVFTGANYRVSEITGAILRVQLRRLDAILDRLRERKRAAVEVLEGSSAFDLAPVNCAAGDCGQVIALQVETQEKMRRLLKLLLARGVMAGTPIDSTGHVYTEWEPVLRQRASNHPGLNAYHMTDVKYEYKTDMCHQSLAVLSHTIGIPVDINEPLDKTLARAQRIRRLADSL